jgi:hypothetical protein
VGVVFAQTLLKVQRYYEDAEPLLRKALDLDSIAEGESRVEVATDLSNMAVRVH